MAAEILDSTYNVIALMIAFGFVLLGYSLLVRTNLFHTPVDLPRKSEFLALVLPGVLFTLVGLIVICGILWHGIQMPVVLPHSTQCSLAIPSPNAHQTKPQATGKDGAEVLAGADGNLERYAATPTSAPTR